MADDETQSNNLLWRENYLHVHPGVVSSKVSAPSSSSAGNEIEMT
jgi:hypothetical protein